ncbi:MAG: hypothetical protein NTV72_03405 [Candidatus Taylorbacteria bacterium]|nr:hypothetical protein [Candidatus Taylorbacteria bacterium]
MDKENLFKSKVFKRTFWILVGIILAILIFRMGMFVGYRRASFSFEWGNNYFRNFAGGKMGDRDGPNGPLGMGEDRDFIDAHGAFGQIIKIEGNSIFSKGSDGVERVITASTSTEIRRFKEMIKFSDLKSDDRIVVIGRPDSAGKIEAKFIRVLPPLK